MEQIISKKEFDELMSMEGKIIGAGIKPSAQFILKEEGEESLKKIEETITNLGYPLKFKEIKTISFYPLGLLAVFLIVVKRIFKYDDKRFEEMGKFAVKVPMVLRFLVRHFLSVDMWAKKGSSYWKRFFTAGSHEIPEWDEKKGYLINKIRGVRFPQSFCQITKGAHAGIMQMVVGKKVTCEETKCVHRGDEYCEFVLKW